MRVAISFVASIAWISWTSYACYRGIGAYETHLHVYAVLFFLGLFAVLAGSAVLKIVGLFHRMSRLITVGSGLWIAGIVLFLGSSLAGVNIEGTHLLQKHVLFNHADFVIFFVGLGLSAYVDLIIIGRYSRFRRLSVFARSQARRFGVRGSRPGAGNRHQYTIRRHR